MHSTETVAEVLTLAESGLGARRISARTGIPVRTISEWLAGRLPRKSIAVTTPRCSHCGAPSHRIEDAANYAYLLGLYLRMVAASRAKAAMAGAARAIRFSNRSADIRRIFCDTCDVLGLRLTESTNTIYVSRKADVARVDEFIGPKR